jgi:peptidyl-prolyl cis-trans isomerase C
VLNRRKVTFEAAAKQYSASPEGAAGGDLGFFGKGEMPPVFDECHALDVKQMSGIVPSDDGFHLFLVTDRRAARVEPLELVHDIIADELLRDRQTKVVDDTLAALRVRHPVTFRASALERVLVRLPAAVAEPVIQGDTGGRALDSHSDGIDPIPPLPKVP